MKKLLIALCVLCFAIPAKSADLPARRTEPGQYHPHKRRPDRKEQHPHQFQCRHHGPLGFIKELDIETGLLFSGHGSRAETFSTGKQLCKTRFNPYYIQAPLNAVIKIPLVKNANLFSTRSVYRRRCGGRSRWESRIGPIIINIEQLHQIQQRRSVYFRAG